MATSNAESETAAAPAGKRALKSKATSAKAKAANPQSPGSKSVKSKAGAAPVDQAQPRPASDAKGAAGRSSRPPAALEPYARKRDFSRTAEPGPEPARTRGELRFVVQRHAASRLHYDFRLELDGVLLSWAVPKGPSRNPKDRRLAVRTEDHPYAYRSFAGTIPEGQYGGGEVWIWDEGTYTALGASNRTESEPLLRQMLAEGNLKVVLQGEQLQGEFALVRMKESARYRGENNWLLIKHKDAAATTGPYDANAVEPLDRPRSVWQSNRPQAAAAAQSTAKPKPKAQTKPTSAAKSGKASPSGTKHRHKAAAAAEPMPHEVQPMLAKLYDAPFNDADWLFEIKWDGYRAVAEIADGSVRLYSRNLEPFEAKYPQLVAELASFPGRAVLDGEIVIVDAEGRSSFQRMQNYAPARDAADLRYYVFDLLYLDGTDLRTLPLAERKARLEAWLPVSSAHVRYSAHVPAEGKAFFAAAEAQGLEGVMAKDARSPYRTGTRSDEWRKLKVQRRQLAVVCGYTAPSGSRKYIGALVLGVYDDAGQLHYAGNSGSGFTQARLKATFDLLQPLRTDRSPFAEVQGNRLARTRWRGAKDVTWVRPALVAEVAYTEWTNEGKLRHPIFQRLVPEVDPQSVRPAAASGAPRASSSPTALSAQPMPSEPAQPAPHRYHDDDLIVTIGEHDVQLTNLDKVYWPDEGITKGDMVAYYQAVADYILPYLRDRPLSLRRCPDGIAGECFYQKNFPPDQLPPYARAQQVDGQSPHYLICDNAATLAYINQLGSIDIHPFVSRTAQVDRPDFLVLDLDPDGNPFEQVVDTALVIRRILGGCGTDSFVKTSGSTGLHVVVPLGARYHYDQARQFAELVANLAHDELPDFTSVERMTKNRKGKLYIDYLQNRPGQTIVAPYSLRPKPGAPVSMPLHWEEVRHGLRIADFHIGNALARITEVGDLFAPLLKHKGVDLLACLQRLS